MTTQKQINFELPAHMIVRSRAPYCYAAYKNSKYYRERTPNKIQYSSIQMYDKNHRAVVKNSHVDLFLKGGQVANTRKPPRAINERIFYTASKGTKKQLMYVTNFSQKKERSKVLFQSIGDGLELETEPIKQDNEISSKVQKKQSQNNLFMIKANTHKSKQMGLQKRIKNQTSRTHEQSVTKQSGHGSHSNMLRPAKTDRPLFYLQAKETMHISADSYIVTEFPSGQIIAGSYFRKTGEIASLTKIMTFYTVYRISQELSRSLSQEFIQIDEEAQAMTGTSAEVFQGDQYTAEQLLYGLMLPSGNDAAIALAKWGGSLLISKQQQQGIMLKENRESNPVKVFVKRMNHEAKNLKLTCTKFANPHGLPHPQSSSNPEEVAMLMAACLKIQLFKEVIKTKKYSCWVEHKGQQHQVIWENTNKLLRRPNFIGGKTGVTVTAGPCLASCYQSGQTIWIVILLRTTKLSRRFKETRQILGLCLSKLNSRQYQSEIKAILRSDPELDSDNSEDEQRFCYDRSDAREIAKRNKILALQM